MLINDMIMIDIDLIDDECDDYDVIVMIVVIVTMSYFVGYEERQ